jgi:serine/threonine-protein kinase RsbW
MEMKVALSLPREAVSAPVARHIYAYSLRVLGVSQECVDDMAVALSEACANVLAHASLDDQYEVCAGVDHRVAVIEVVDTGGGLDGADGLGREDADVTSERGRGIQLIRGLMDNVTFEVIEGRRRGTRVRLEKLLEWEDGAPIGLLGADRPLRCLWTDETHLGHPADHGGGADHGGDVLHGTGDTGSAPAPG